ncbi:deoxycytidylate deaminase [Shewanella sp. Choline-02u-19]|uniref:GGDEF domain-containing protein n=1 Tax=unclassified Shewanella TaxID=196818 RepID=UPI000C330AB0|nr:MULTISPECIES: GGDEF domain-containing protein [unclassified Shewanella]PKG57074.1 deoxycytidylate deaminase [Shewanella sp. GutDb-MelDb]PKG76376.1 deoxycytidylate deaminase [Shewanella sp. GutCb]PKH57497.1 deoxycytidylate deaminase [Shewanella sp. Bg11-22]PKI28359.1 deoxycytidylate deaminase [Shewanella sp. Choline-02u-19]
MKDAVASTSQLSVLQQKLYSARQALDDMNEDQNKKLQLLLQFISQLSLACKGQNIELDNKLAKLRHKLSRFSQIDNAITDLNDVEGVLKQQYNHVMLQLEESRSSLSNIVSQIQRIESLPTKLKKEISYFKKELVKPFHTYWDYIPKVEKIIQFYDEILNEQLRLGEQFEVLPRHRQSAHELALMLSEIEFRKEQREQISSIKLSLTEDFELDTLLNAYQVVLSLLLDNIAKEKTASQEFLYILNGALSNVREVVTDSYTHSVKSFQVAKKLNGEINNQVDNIDESVAETNDIDHLKTQVTEQLLALRTALSRKEALENREQIQLRQSVEALRRELNELSKETETYKKRLFEQQKLNLLDSLTQLPNRAALEERMDIEYRNYKRTQQPLWVAVADIDHFKTINDSFGHSTGDKTLQVIAMALKSSLRDTEFVARYGGEEFVFLLPDIGENDIKPLLDRVREKVKSIPFKFKNQRITVTVSIGAAQIIENELISETFERADAALYKAKHESRDRVIIDS